MPIPLRRATQTGRNRWLDNYLTLILERDLRDISRLRLVEQIPGLLSGLASRLLRLTPEKLAARNPASLSQFGHLLETFVGGELCREASWMEGIAALGHWRTHDGQEADLIVERDDGAVLAFEVKAGRQVTKADARHLLRLRETLGERLLAGVVLCMGPRSYRLDNRIHVLPIDRLWQAA